MARLYAEWCIAGNPEFFYDDQPYKRAFASNYYEDYACDMFISKLEKFEGSAEENQEKMETEEGRL